MKKIRNQSSNQLTSIHQEHLTLSNNQNHSVLQDLSQIEREKGQKQRKKHRFLHKYNTIILAYFTTKMQNSFGPHPSEMTQPHPSTNNPRLKQFLSDQISQLHSTPSPHLKKHILLQPCTQSQTLRNNSKNHPRPSSLVYKCSFVLYLLPGNDSQPLAPLQKKKSGFLIPSKGAELKMRQNCTSFRPSATI